MIVTDDRPVPEGPALPAVNQIQLYEQAYELVREAILRGRFKPGQRLSADQLAKNLGVSQTPVRAALTRLEGDGLVEILPRRGTFVARFTEKDVREVFQLRRMIECAGLERLDRLPDRAIERMEQIVAESAALVDGQRFLDYSRYIQLDAEFHRLIVGLLENERASALYQGLRWPVQIMRGLSASQYQRSLDTVAEHSELLAALKERDAGRAKGILLRHLDNSEADLVRRLG